jgi:5-methylcytosine-specific restriction protein A
MARLKAIKSRLSSPPSRLSAPSVTETRRASSSGGERRSKNWLNTARWQRLRRKILIRDDYVCRATGVSLVGNYPAGNSPVVDHRIPHRGDPDLFWDEDNLQSVSKEYHDRIKQSIEKRGQV